MIIEYLLIALMSILAWFFSLFNFISMPLWIIQGADASIDFMMFPFGVITNYVGADFMTSLFLIIVTIFPIIYSFLLIKWILTKIKVLGS